MKEVTITLNRFEELLYKEAAYEMKRMEVKNSSYASDIDKLLFGDTEKVAESEEDDF